MNARPCLVLALLGLAGCEGILGLHDINPDGDPFGLTLTVPSNGFVAQPLGIVTISAQDVVGRPATTFNGQIRLTLGNNPGGATLLGTTTVTAKDGIATVDLLGIDKAGNGYTVVATAEGLPPVTATINIAEPRFKPVKTGISGSTITSIAVSPGAAGSPSTVFVGAADTVYKSVDGGGTWTAAGFGAPVQGQLEADRRNPGVVYVKIGYGSGVRKTTDGGATWHSLADNFFPNTFAIDPRDAQVMYAVDNQQRSQKSTDGGVTWTQGATINCQRLVVDQVTADTLYCQTYDPNTGSPLGVSKSSNGGASWAPANTGIATPFDYSPVLATTSTAVFVSYGGKLYRSTDGAASWTVVSSTYNYAVAAAPSMPNRVYASQCGVAVSNDGGATFAAQVGVGNDCIQTIAVDPSNPNEVYAGGPFNVYVSHNGGTSWAVASNGIDANYVQSVAIQPGASQTVLAATRGQVLRSTNGAASWTATAAPNLTSLQFDPVNSMRVYGCGYGYFSVSTNSGASFTGGQIVELSNNNCARLAIVGSTLYMVGNNQMHKSTNGGTSWTTTGLTTSLPAGAYVYDGAVGDATGDTILVATSLGIFRSTNGGATFTKTGTAMNVNRIVSDPKGVGRVVTGECSGFRTSINGGEAFGAVLPGPCVQQMAATGGAIYAIGSDYTSGAQKFVLTRSTDGGATWASVELSGTITQMYVSSITAADDGNTVYVATQGGLFRGSFN